MKSEAVFRKILLFSGILVVLLIVGIFATLLINSIPSIREFGISFLYSKEWDPVFGKFGSLPFLVGTLLTSFLSIIISFPLSLAISIFLGEYFKQGNISTFLKSMVELLAGIPSVVYGFWGIIVLIPLVRYIEIKLGVMPIGVGIFTSSLILAVMIVPYSAALGREVISIVPSEIKEAAYSLGATKYEVIRSIILPYVRSGIIAGVLLSLGRALGETMAVTMLIGNSNFMPENIFSPGNSMASVIANEFTEATENLHLSALVEIGLILFIVTAIVNYIGRKIIKKTSLHA